MLSHAIYEKVNYEKNPFDSIPVSKNTDITYYYKEELDLLSEYQKNAKIILIEMLIERGDEDHER